MRAMIEWQLERLPLSSLTDWYKNPRQLTREQYDQLRQSLDKFGLIDKPIVNADGARTVIGGHQRLRVLRDSGVTEADCWVPLRELSEREVEELNIRLNKNTGEFDFDILANEFEVEDLLEWGFSEIELQIGGFADEDEDNESDGNGEGDGDGSGLVDAAEELREKWGVETGQIWEAGLHRIVCGDCTDSQVIQAAVQSNFGSVVDAVITSPPYGVGKEYEAAGLSAWEDTIAGMLHAIADVVELLAINLGDIKVGPGHREVHTYGRLVELCGEYGFPLLGTRIWSKGAAWAGQGPYWLSSYRAVDEFEYIGLFGVTQYTDRIDTDWRYRGIWDIPSVSANKLHSAAFPIELPRRLMLLLTDDGATILDPFVGSGTTLVACENEGRIGIGIERDPRYVAVTLERLQGLGLDVQLVSPSTLGDSDRAPDFLFLDDPALVASVD